MQYHINAILAGSKHTEGDVLVVGGAGEDGNYFQFQRGLTQDVGMDDPPYFEIVDQIDGGYGIVSRCIVSRKNILIELKNEIRDVSSINVNLEKVTFNYSEFVKDLVRIFSGYEEQLIVEKNA